MYRLFRKKVIYHDVELDFTRAEFDLIEVLSSYPGQVFDKELLYEKHGDMKRGG